MPEPLRACVVAALVAVLAPSELAAQTPAPQRAKVVATAEGLTEYALPNGVKVLLFPDPSRAIVAVSSVYFVGSKHEAYGESGMAHLLEHMLFKSTKNHPDILKEYHEQGASRSGATGVDVTRYTESAPASDANLNWALDLHADRAANANITTKDLESEFTVVRNEMENDETDPSTFVRHRLFNLAFDWHAYGRRTVGARSDIEGMNIDRLRAFYQRYYQPDNMMLIVAGRFDPARTLAIIEKKFGVIPRPRRSLAAGNLLARVPTVEPIQDGERFSAVRRVGDAQMLQIGYRAPAASHVDAAVIDVLTDVLGSNPSGRLFKALVETREAVSVDAGIIFAAEPSVFAFRIRMRMDQNIDSVRARTLRLIDSARTGTFTSEEVARARTSRLRNIELAASDVLRLSGELAFWAGSGDWRLYFLHRDRIAKVTPQDLQRVAANYLKPSNSTIVAFIPTPSPDRAQIPAPPNIAAELAGYVAGAGAAVGEAFDPTPDSVNGRTVRSSLPSGMQVTLLPKRSRNGRVAGQIVVRFGTEASLMRKTQVAALTAQMLMRGTATLTRQQLIDSLSKLTSAVSVVSAANSFTVNIETTRANFLSVLEIVAQQLRTPRLDPDDLDRLKKERLLVHDNAKSQPTDLGYSALYQRLTPKPRGHPLAAPTPVESIEDVTAVTIDDVRAFHRAYIGGSFGDLALVGDFDVPAVTAAATRLLGDWKSQQPYARIPRAYARSDSTLVTIETPDKANAATWAGLTFPVGDGDPDYPALAIAHFILAETAASRMAVRLREKEGLSYGMPSFLSANSFDSWSVWQFYAIHAPQNVERVSRAFRDEIDRARAEGVTAAELDRAKTGYLGLRHQFRTNDATLAGQLVARRISGRTFDWDKTVESKIAALTVDQVNAAFRTYFVPSDIVMVRLGDFANHPPVKPTP